MLLQPIPSQSCWSGSFTIDDTDTANIIDKWVLEDHLASNLEESAPVDKQDPWESRRAWRNVIAPLKTSDLSLAVAKKLEIEEAQRSIRNTNPNHASDWDPLFFSASYEDQPDFESLASAIPGWKLDAQKTLEVWKFDRERRLNVL